MVWKICNGVFVESFDQLADDDLCRPGDTHPRALDPAH
jgi:hypothetical protein